MSNTMLTVMIYDVSDDKRRNRLFGMLKEYGVSVQWSAFEARMTAGERERLRRRVEALLDRNCDRFAMYTIPKDHEARIIEVGRPRPVVEAPRYWIV